MINSADTPPPLHRRVAIYNKGGNSGEIHIAYTCHETQADGEVDVSVEHVSLLRKGDHSLAIWGPLSQLIDCNDLTWTQAIANAPLVVDEFDDSIIIRDSRK